MSLTNWLPTVRLIKDGETVDQATENIPLQQLIQRDQHLYEKFEELSGKSVLISFGQPIHPSENFLAGEQSIAYFRSDNLGAGLGKSLTGFTSSASSSMFSPNKSNYAFGLVKTVYAATTVSAASVDLYTEGLCELAADLDDPVLGLIQKQTDGVVEPFEVGPYYLSARSPGKITKDPSGIPVYIGYAISKRKFLLHTNVDEFSQFFINYRYHLLDRVAGIPTLTTGTWSITSADLTKLGWIPAASAGVTIPAGAVFFYNIPTSTQLTADTALTTAERDEATELRRYLPPVPANFIQLYANGVLARYNNTYDTAGVFSVNEYGVWWHTAANGQQPWGDDYTASAPSTWATLKNTVTRRRVFTSFSKFNPALRTQLVSSLAAFNTTTDKSANFIKLVSKDNISEAASTGDLILSVDPQFDLLGLDAAAFTYPTGVATTYTAGQAVAALKYSKPDGKFKAVITPVVAKLIGQGGITVTQGAAGVWTVDYLSRGASGQVDSIEPINSRLEFRGLSSYIKLPPPSTTPYGLIGKIVLPAGYPTDKRLRLVFHLFGDANVLQGAANRKVAFQFEYTSVSAANGDSPTAFNLINTSKYSPATIPATPQSTNPVVFDLLAGPAAYTAFTGVKIAHVDFSIPAIHVTGDSVISYQLTRVATPNPLESFGGNVGLLSTYWEIPNT